MVLYLKHMQIAQCHISFSVVEHDLRNKHVMQKSMPVNKSLFFKLGYWAAGSATNSTSEVMLKFLLTNMKLSW